MFKLKQAFTSVILGRTFVDYYVVEFSSLFDAILRFNAWSDFLDRNGPTAFEGATINMEVVSPEGTVLRELERPAYQI